VEEVEGEEASSFGVQFDTFFCFNCSCHLGPPSACRQRYSIHCVASSNPSSSAGVRYPALCIYYLTALHL
jgi:hypothetical protein